MFSAKKLDKLMAAGIITSSQKQQILDFDKNENSGIIAKLLIVLGIFILSIGVISMVAANWENIGRTVKLLTMFLLLCLVGGTAVYYERKGETIKAEKVLLLLFLLCGAAIGLVIQVFQLQGEDIFKPIGFWCLAGLPLLAVAKKKFVAWFWVPLFFVWFVCHVLSSTDWEATDYPLWFLGVFGLFAAVGAGGEYFCPSLGGWNVLKKDSQLIFYLSLAVYICSAFWLPMRFVFSAVILLCLSFVFRYFKAYGLIRCHIKFGGFWVVMLYVYLGEKVGLFRTGVGLIVSGIILILLVKYWPRVVAPVKENRKDV